ncbi:hypothetical protein KZF83_005067 [Escherichia coli]|nr:hypothetical protein [Escherichia coli]ELO0115741.1 hypothetical protein [Escherichia coli O157]EMF1484493.1 hypothetical protein [Escherichia coli]HBB8676413.1 hypothetical protein [Escherichia coli]
MTLIVIPAFEPDTDNALLSGVDKRCFPVTLTPFSVICSGMTVNHDIY